MLVTLQDYTICSVHMSRENSFCRLGRADKPKSATMAKSWSEYPNDTDVKIDVAKPNAFETSGLPNASRQHRNDQNMKNDGGVRKSGRRIKSARCLENRTFQKRWVSLHTAYCERK